MIPISLVVAVSRNGVIGRDGGLPWHLPSDLKRFKAVTLGKPVIMGRKTWDSLPRKPLPGRRNIVLTRGTFLDERADAVATVDLALSLARQDSPEEICVIGGGEIYRLFMPLASRLYLTEVDLECDGDTRLPLFNAEEWQETARVTVPQQSGEAAGYAVRMLKRL